MRASRCEPVAIRGLRYNVRHWGEEGAPVLFLLHGWMDASATFQFVVDALRHDWHLIAPDWRGYGESEWLSRPYWFPDYYADLDALFNHYSPDQAANVVGHSMGANIAATYAGVRPERIARLVMLDFLGLKPAPGNDAPSVIGRWLDEIAEPPRLRIYPDQVALARRLLAVNPRLTRERAEFLAEHVGRPAPEGGHEMACDPWHKVAAPAVYRIEDALAAWEKVTAPVMLVNAEKGFVNQRFGRDTEEFWRRANHFRNLRVEWVADAGHNLQHDQPEAVAALIESFFETAAR